MAGRHPLRRRGKRAIMVNIFAGMMELVDMRDLGSRAHALGFESPCPHQKCPPLRAVPFWCALLRCKSGRLRADNCTRKGNPAKVSLAHIPFLAVYAGSVRPAMTAGCPRNVRPCGPPPFGARFCAAKAVACKRTTARARETRSGFPLHILNGGRHGPHAG